MDVRNTSGLLSSAYRLARRNQGAVLLVGAGFKILLLELAARWGGKTIFLRMGGDPRTDFRAEFKAAISAGNYRAALRIAVNRVPLRLIYTLTHDFIVVNTALKATLHNQVGHHTPIHVIPQPGFGPSRARDHAFEGPAKLLTVTNLKYQSKAEGVLWQIEQLAENISAFPEGLDLRIAGGGDCLAEVEHHLASADLPASLRVRLLGHVEKIDDEYERADILLYRSHHDATPNVLLEAKRWSLPVLVNDFAPLLNVVAHRHSALVYSTPKEFLEGLQQLVSNRQLREQLAAAGRQEFETDYSTDAVAQKLADLLNSRVAPQ